MFGLVLFIIILLANFHSAL